MNEEFELKNKEGKGSGIFVEAFEVPGKIALWLKMKVKEKTSELRREIQLV